MSSDTGSVTLNCQVIQIVMNSGSQWSQPTSQCVQRMFLESMVAVGHLLWTEGCAIAQECAIGLGDITLQTPKLSPSALLIYHIVIVIVIVCFSLKCDCSMCKHYSCTVASLSPLLRLEHLDSAGETVTAPGDTTDISWAGNPHCQHF